ncbi:hypothetical protein [Kitasatospora albolonga]|uniref:hypothetical protein n=1 Tax=Kitasatospora albolonga TaxID=68173 RepID=UPI0031F06EB3
MARRQGRPWSRAYGAAPEPAHPMRPCFDTAFDALVAWTTRGGTPPPSATVPVSLPLPTGAPSAACAL